MNRAAVENRRVADRHLVTDAGRVRPAHHVNHGAVLDIRAIADANRVDVAADDDVHPDAALLADLDIPDYLGALVDIGGWMDLREDRLERAKHEGIISAPGREP